LLKGTASAVPKQATAQRPTALPKAGAKAKPERPNHRIATKSNRQRVSVQRPVKPKTHSNKANKALTIADPVQTRPLKLKKDTLDASLTQAINHLFSIF
jgi:hypothetical protein